MGSVKHHLRGVLAPEDMAKAMGVKKRMEIRMDRLLIDANVLADTSLQLEQLLGLISESSNANEADTKQKVFRGVSEAQKFINIVKNQMLEVADTGKADM